ncbi:hypothetical protein [Brevibacillus porteri]|uniref:hypothetical protein n=1 Tax=Brevibacillus porteri TaxID=2126350 RepID=UPI0036251B95
MFKLSTKVVLIWIGVLLFLLLAGLLAKSILFPAHVANKAADTAYGVVDKTLNAENALYNYENFQNLYQGAKQQASNIENAKSSIKRLKEVYGEDTSTWDKEATEQLNLALQNIDGYAMQYQRIVAEYNADSKKLNRNLFKDKELPYELPISHEELN